MRAEVTLWTAIKGITKSLIKHEESNVMYYQWQIAMILGIEK